MKKLLMVLGGVFGVVLLLAFGAFMYGVINGPTLDRESKAWVDKTIPEIVSSWSSQKFFENSGTKFLESISKEDTEEVLSRFLTELGPMKEYKGSTGEAGIHFNNFTHTVTAEYVAQADFEKGSADIFVQAIQEQNQWKIYNFHVNIKGVPPIIP